MAKLLITPYRIGFITGHYYLDECQISRLRQILNYHNNNKAVSEYEMHFARLIGPGYGVSFAAGRMAFFALLKILNIGQGDEVILTGFTCSVMPNAVWRVGATPIFADIDIETFGSDVSSIESKITPRTKLIVAQHSFGIPCKIKDIVKLGKEKGIFVVEDCAITLDSSFEGTKVGNWADAAIFSTDHTKPINTLIGGLFYTKDKMLYEKIKAYEEGLPNFTLSHQKRLFMQFMYERRNLTPLNYPRSILKSKIKRAIKYCCPAKDETTFLEADYQKQPSSCASYPYPAKMPSFLAQLGLFELQRWEHEKKRRINLLREYINIAMCSDSSIFLPKTYFNTNAEITPLRFVFRHPNSKKLEKKMARFIDVNGAWFRVPIVSCADGPESLGYSYGSCPVSEAAGDSIMNWPCNVPIGWEPKVLNLFRDFINS